MPLLSVDVADLQFAIDSQGGLQKKLVQLPWPKSPDVERGPSPYLWLPISDINGLGEASLALARIRNKVHPGMPKEAIEQRQQLIDIAIRVIYAEREIMLKEFLKLLSDAFPK